MITDEEIKDGKVIIKRNFITHKEATDFWYLTNTCSWKYGNVSNTYSSQKQKRMTLPFELETFIQTELFGRINNLFKEDLGLAKAYVNYSDHATVNLPHCDGENAGPTIMMCLNQEWKKDWGGYTVIFKDMHSCDVAYTSVPEPGKLVIFNGGAWHTGVPIAHFADYPRYMLTLHCTLEKEIK